MAYATVEDVQKRMTRTLSQDEETVCATLLEDAGILIDQECGSDNVAVKGIVSCRMVIRAIGDGSDMTVPVGATQGSMSALGYAQSWTINSGSVGELYLSKADRRMLGMSNTIGSYSPVESLAQKEGAL